MALTTYIPNLEEETAQLREVGTAGYFLGFNYTLKGPEMMVSGYPEEWQAEYENRNYYFGDPILMWMGMNSGSKRWSEITFPDPRGIMKRAEEACGLRYGAALSAKKGRKRSFLTVARSDREVSDVEMSMLSAKFDVWCELATNRAALTDKEIDVLRLLRDGTTQKVIAETLGVAEVTVKHRAMSATTKLGASNRIQAVALAISRGYLE